MARLKISKHGATEEAAQEILFKTRFGYLFPEVAADPAHRVPLGSMAERQALDVLAVAMSEPGTGPGKQSRLPSFLTYFGQFIDHDVTARTDRETGRFEVGPGAGVCPVDPAVVERDLANGRRPCLDLDSVYGDGPAFATDARSEAQLVRGGGLFEDDLTMKLDVIAGTNGEKDRIDLKRVDVTEPDGTKVAAAIIADERNDENLIVGQVHAAFLRLHNTIAAALPKMSDQERFLHARRLTTWTYQYLVVHDYLMRICNPSVVRDVLWNGPRYLGPAAGRLPFMPLEFSVAAFRMGHSMIRGSYEVRAGDQRTITELLNHRPESGQLLAADRIDWNLFVDPRAQGAPFNFARKLDPRIAQGLFNLPFGQGDPILAHLARRNVFRSVLLSIPTGQTMAKCFGIQPLTEGEIEGAVSGKLKAALAGELAARTPLWTYVLLEAKIQGKGEQLGELGSRIVAETLIGFLKTDPNTYLNHAADERVQAKGILLPDDNNGTLVGSFREMLAYADLV